MSDDRWNPVTLENCGQVLGPFYHGTKVDLVVGELLCPGHPSNYEEGRISRNLYFSAILEPAIWGAELAMSFAGLEGRGRIYLVEPTGPFEDDPNLTNKRSPGNPTRSYRTPEPVRVVGVVEDWEGHSEDAIRGMLASIQDLKRRGLAVIDD
ncbi:MAG: NAD(+)--rifampin ADP-ribosyltransferase [Myxococcales bacterium]